MPQNFLNTPDGQPLSVDESRKRLRSLVNRQGTQSEGKIRSRIAKRHRDYLEERESRDSSGIREDIDKLEGDHKVDSRSEVRDAAESLRNGDVLSATTEGQIDEQKLSGQEVSLSKETLNNGDREVGIPDVNLPPDSGEYWHSLWETYIHEGKLIGGGEKKLILEVALPQENEVEIAAAEQMYAGLIGAGSKPGKFFETVVSIFSAVEIFFKNPRHALSYEIIADSESIRFWVIVPESLSDFIERQIHGAYPEADISQAETGEFLTREGNVYLSEIKTKGKPFYPIRTADDLEVDSLSSIASAVSKLTPNERVIMQFLIQPADDSWRKRGQRFVHIAQSPPKSEKEKKPSVDPKIIEAISEKISKPGFRLSLRVVVESSDQVQAEHLLDNIVRSFDQFSIPHLAKIEGQKLQINKDTAEDFILRRFPQWGNYPVLNTMELATLYHFPNKEVQTPRIKWLKFRKSPPPTNIPKEGLYLGVSEYRNNEVKVNLEENARRRHLYIIGQTGTGKSEFLKFLAQQDIVQGRGLAFIDPHGDAVLDLLQMIPKDRAEDVIYFNPGDSERPMGLNILDARTEEGKHMVVNSFIALLYKLYDPNHTGMVGPQLERAVRNVMLTAMEEKGNSMIEVLKLLIDPKFAESKIGLIKDPLVKSFWVDQMSQTSDFHRSETLGYFVSKFDRFVTEKLMRNIIGQSKSAFDFRDVMDKRKILLVNLSKGTIGEENSNFLGLLLVPRILAAAMSRVDMPEEQRPDFFLYVDEFQNFATPDFAQILAEARKYRLGLVVANQFIAQIQDQIRDAVFGNVGTMVSFRVGPDDAEYLEKQFTPVFSQSDLINLTIGQCVCRLLIGGQPSRPFTFKTDYPAIQGLPRNKKVAEVITEISRLKFGRDRRLVESEIAARAGFD